MQFNTPASFLCRVNRLFIYFVSKMIFKTASHKSKTLTISTTSCDWLIPHLWSYFKMSTGVEIHIECKNHNIVLSSSSFMLSDGWKLPAHHINKQTNKQPMDGSKDKRNLVGQRNRLLGIFLFFPEELKVSLNVNEASWHLDWSKLIPSSPCTTLASRTFVLSWKRCFKFIIHILPLIKVILLYC